MEPRLVDSHCHLDHLDTNADHGALSGMLARARAQGVVHLLAVAVDLESYEHSRRLAACRGDVSFSVGVHPNGCLPREPDEAELSQRAGETGVIAVGETGLDYHRSHGDLAWQRARFRRHIAVARHVNKPLIVHCREARGDVVRILEEEKANEIGGVFHCFVEDWQTARRVLELGFLLSFSGVVTFKNASVVQEVAARVPLDRLLVETDAPYLSPAPYRGQPNEPGRVRTVAAHIAKIRATSLEVVAEASTTNFFRLFKDAGESAVLA